MKKLIAAVAIATVLSVAALPASAQDEPKLRVAELIAQVRAELAEAEKRLNEEQHPVLFYAKGLELELNFVVEESTKGGGFFDLIIVTLGGDAEHSESEIQKITLQFETQLPPLRAVEYGAWQEIRNEVQIPVAGASPHETSEMASAD